MLQQCQLGTLQEALGVKPGTNFKGCSERVAEALGPDVMKSVKPLIPDLLAALPVLLYQGVSQTDQYTVIGIVNSAACHDHRLRWSHMQGHCSCQLTYTWI